MGNSSSKQQFSMRMAMTNWLFSPLAGITLKNWGHLLKSHGTSIHMRYWPRSLFTTFMAFINSSFAVKEQSAYSHDIKKMEVKSPVFVIGHHRSGTTHLWNLLTQDKRFVYPSVLQAVFPHTFLVFEDVIHGLAERFAPSKRPQDNVSLNPDSPIEEERAICVSTFLSVQMGRHFSQKRDEFKKYLTMRDASSEERELWKETLQTFAQKLLVKYGQDAQLIFKTPDHTAKVKLILEAFPDARIIHIHREPYRVYRSTMKMEKTTLPLYAYQKPEHEHLEEYVLWRYRTMYDALFEDIKQIPDGQFIEVSYEEVDKNPLETIQNIYRDLSLPNFEEARPRLKRYLKSIAGYQKNRYDDLPRPVMEKIETKWEPVFTRYGYEKRSNKTDG